MEPVNAIFLGWKNSLGTAIVGEQPPVPLFVVKDCVSTDYPYTSVCGRYCFRESEFRVMSNTPFNLDDYL